MNGKFCTSADGHRKNQQKDPQREKQTLRSTRITLPQIALSRGGKEIKKGYNALLLFSAALTLQLLDLETLESISSNYLILPVRTPGSNRLTSVVSKQLRVR